MNSLTILFLITTAQYGLPAGLLSSLCYVESGHRVEAVHKHDGNGNSVGVCQIKLKTARTLGFKGTEKQLMDPKINIQYAGKYLNHQIKRYHGSTVKAVIAYNQGHAGSLTTTHYSVKVIKQWRTNNERYAKY
jgi:soluble lytic murein transglycosylase-like protein